jgi:hypothetical protein
MNAHVKYNVWFILRLCLLLAPPFAASAAEISDLWGRSGEKWTPQSRLPDFSFAGYHGGEAPLPILALGVSVKDFGAKGDGIADDTQAFLDALAKAKTGAIEIPAGRYKITNILEITRPGVVLRGAGADRTFLFFPVPLNDIKPNWSATTGGERTSEYSWAGGLVWFKGTERGKSLATVTAGAKRGDTSLQVSATNLFQPGQRIQIFQTDAADKSLTAELYSGDPGKTDKMGRVRVSLGKNTGARATFWNIRARKPIPYPPSAFGPPSMNLVGLRTDGPSVKQPDGKWFEAIPPEALSPQDLHAAQLARRLAGH